MPKSDFNKVTFAIQTLAWQFSISLLNFFRTPFAKNISGMLLLFLPTISQSLLASPSILYKILSIFVIKKYQK